MKIEENKIDWLKTGEKIKILKINDNVVAFTLFGESISVEIWPISLLESCIQEKKINV